MHTITITTNQAMPVKYLQARCGVRYWEDATVNGVADEDGSRIPCREGGLWAPLIDLENGKIENWTQGVIADIHYKVCDEGIYSLLNDQREEVITIDDYVPSIMCPKDNGYGDYVIMDVDANGVIQNWKVTLDAFEQKRR